MMEHNEILDRCTTQVNILIKRFRIFQVTDEDKKDIIQHCFLDCIKYNERGKELNEKSINYIVKKSMFCNVPIDVFRKREKMIKLGDKNSYNI